MAKIDQKEERTMGMLCHLLAFAGFVIPLGNIIGPLVVWLVKKEASKFVDFHGKESLNFQISMLIYCIIGAILTLVIVGIFILIALGILMIVTVIVASVKASEGKEYHYPLRIKFIH